MSKNKKELRDFKKKIRKFSQPFFRSIVFDFPGSPKALKSPCFSQVLVLMILFVLFSIKVLKCSNNYISAFIHNNSFTSAFRYIFTFSFICTFSFCSVQVDLLNGR